MGVAVKIPDLVELAVSPASMGPGLLKSFLHALINYLGLKDLKVEFRGSDTKMVQDLANKMNAGSGHDSGIIQLIMTPNVDSKESVGVASSASSVEGRKGEDTIIVENGVVRDPYKKRISYNSFSRLEGKVKSLQAQIEALNSQVLPTDDTLLQETRSKQEAKPITDLVHSLNITKRMSGAEEGLDKLASLLETIAKEYSDLRAITETMQTHFGEDIAETMDQIKMAAKYARYLKPREEYLRKFRTKRKDEGTTTDSEWSGLLKTGLNASVGMGEEILGKQLSTQPSSVSVRAGQKGGNEIGTESGIGSKLGVKGSKMRPDGAERNVDTIPSIRTTSMILNSKKDMAGSVQFSQQHLPGQEAALEESPIASVLPDSFGSLFSVIPSLNPEDKVDADRINKLLAQHELLKKNMDFVVAQVNTLAEFADVIVPELLAGMPHATELRRRIAELQKDNKSSCPEGPEEADDIVVTSKDLNERMEGAEARLIKHQAKLKRQDMMLAEKTMDLDNRIGKLTKSLADVVEVLGLRKHKHKPKEEEEMDQIFGKIGNVEEALIEIGCATQNLLDDKEYKMTLLENLTEEIKLIKTLKLDRFEMEDILASKADCDELNKKVPLDRFDEVTNDLARGIDEALNKVSAQQSLLAATLLDMQNSLETKFDKAEVESLKEEFQAQMQALKEELARLSAMKEGRVAAGGRRKFVTDVNCLSCDRNVAMATETGVPCIPALADLTHTRSIRPFITYELEYLRKMKIKDPEIIKYIEYEELFRRYKLKTTDSYENLANVPHIKNRYCGGAHTVTGPQQKVPHTGHFDLKKSSSGKKLNV